MWLTYILAIPIGLVVLAIVVTIIGICVEYPLQVLVVVVLLSVSFWLGMNVIEMVGWFKS